MTELGEGLPRYVKRTVAVLVAAFRTLAIGREVRKADLASILHRCRR